MIEKKNFWMIVFLSIITCGIYYWIYLYQVTKDLNTMAGNDGRGTDPGTVVLLSIVTCGIYRYFWVYNYGNRMQELGRANNIPVEESGTSYLLWEILGMLVCALGGYVALYFFVNNFNKLADAYNAGMSQYPPYGGYNSNQYGGPYQGNY